MSIGMQLRELAKILRTYLFLMLTDNLIFVEDLPVSVAIAMSRSTAKPPLVFVESHELSMLEEGPVNMNACGGSATEGVIECSKGQDEVCLEPSDSKMLEDIQRTELCGTSEGEYSEQKRLWASERNDADQPESESAPMETSELVTVSYATPKERSCSNADRGPHTTAYGEIEEAMTKPPASVGNPSLMGLQEKPEIIQQEVNQLEASKPSESADNPALLELQEMPETTQQETIEQLEVVELSEYPEDISEELVNTLRKAEQSDQTERKTTEGSIKLVMLGLPDGCATNQEMIELPDPSKAKLPESSELVACPVAVNQQNVTEAVQVESVIVDVIKTEVTKESIEQLDPSEAGTPERLQVTRDVSIEQPHSVDIIKHSNTSQEQVGITSAVEAVEVLYPIQTETTGEDGISRQKTEGSVQLAIEHLVRQQTTKTSSEKQSQWVEVDLPQSLLGVGIEVQNIDEDAIESHLGESSAEETESSAGMACLERQQTLQDECLTSSRKCSLEPLGNKSNNEMPVESTGQDVTEARKTSIAFEQSQQASEVENDEQALKVEVYQRESTVEVDVNPQSSVEPGTSLAALELLGGYDTAEEEVTEANEADDVVTSHQLNQSIAQKEPTKEETKRGSEVKEFTMDKPLEDTLSDKQEESKTLELEGDAAHLPLQKSEAGQP